MAAVRRLRANEDGKDGMHTVETSVIGVKTKATALTDASGMREDTTPTMVPNDYDNNRVNEHGLYEEYAALHDPQWAADWLEEESHSPKRRKEAKPLQEVVQELTDDSAGLEAGFQTTYKPTRYEETFLQDALKYFYDVGLIEDVLASVKGGKEASVFRCKPNEMLDVEYLAAKVYRPRRFRNLRNDKIYREGREVLSAAGKTVKANERRYMAALKKKSTFGVQAAHTSWMMHEYSIMDDLFNAGANVPRPYAVSDNAILMDYVGDGGRAAPTLHEIVLDPAVAQSLFDVVLRNVDILLQHGVVHGDLSAYNILYWEGDLTIIDFPQIANIEANPNAHRILARDIRRVCDYFGARGVQCDPMAITLELWKQYDPNPVSLRDVEAELSRFEEEEEM